MHPPSAESGVPFARPLDTICDVEPEISSSCYSDLISSQFKQVGQIANDVPGVVRESDRFSPHPSPTIALDKFTGALTRRPPLMEDPCRQRTHRASIYHRRNLKGGGAASPAPHNLLLFQRTQCGCLLCFPIMVLRHINKTPPYLHFPLGRGTYPWAQKLVRFFLYLNAS